jgi:amino acid adenylation domain-containing protein
MAEEPNASPRSLLIEGEGAIDLARLRGAVEEAARVNPGARLVLRGNHWMDSLVPPRVRVATVGELEPLEDAAFVREPLDAERGPTCEIIVVLRSGIESALVFRAFHGVMDGHGLVAWARDVFRAWRRESTLGAWSKENDATLARRLSSVNGQVRPLRLVPESGLHASPLGENAGGLSFATQARSVQGPRMGVLAKIAAATASFSDQPRSHFLLPVDLRRHDRSVSSTANLEAPLALDVANGETWGEVYPRLVRALAERRELASVESEGVTSRLPGWARRGVAELVRRGVRRGDAYAASAVIEHIGRVELRDVSAPEFQARRVVALPAHGARVPLSIAAIEHGDHVEVAVTYADAPVTGAHACRLLDAIATALTAEEPNDWSGNETSAPYPRDETIASLFLARASESPDAVALVREGTRVTYAELRDRAEAIAGKLAALGVAPGAIVGLVVERTEDAVAALLAVLLAGGAYLPIDPRYPDERVRLMLADAGVRLCIAHAAHAARVTGVFDGEVMQVEDLGEETDSPPTTALLTPAAATDLAYVIYTSGSTGRPKGVAVEHQSLVNYVVWARKAYGVEPSSRFALFTSLSFDLSVTSLLLPLATGASVALFPGEIDHTMLRRVLTESGVNALKLTPTHLDLIDALEVTANIRVAIVGGEQLRGPMAARAQRTFGRDCRIVNEYGPTEATVGCVTHAFDLARDGQAPAVPIGVPMSNVRIHLLDETRRAVPPGETGEIYIAGESLARGYLGDEAKTRERFVTLDSGERAYRTGDLGRLTEDGVLEFLGRTDDQIKIRGHRVEPGEIVAALETHPRVARAVVLGRKRSNEAQDMELCAYVVPRGAFDRAELRAYLEARLPHSMVPAFCIAVGDIPLTVNGKIDVRALPDPFPRRATAAPRLGAQTEPWFRPTPAARPLSSVPPPEPRRGA